MEVLVSPSVSPPPSPEKAGSSYPFSSSSARFSSSSLLDRRLGSDSTTSLKLSQSHPILSDGRSPNGGRTRSTSRLQLRGTNRSAVSGLSFTPLSPIMSPPLTAAAATLASLHSIGPLPDDKATITLSDDTPRPSTSFTEDTPRGDSFIPGDTLFAEPIAGPSMPTLYHSTSQEDYLNKGQIPSQSSSEVSLSEAVPAPLLWSTTPPTPPPKLPEKPPSIAKLSAIPNPVMPSTDSNPPMSYRRPVTSSSMRSRSHDSRLSLPARRRASLPYMASFSKPLPLPPPPLPSPSTKPQLGKHNRSPLVQSVSAQEANLPDIPKEDLDLAGDLGLNPAILAVKNMDLEPLEVKVSRPRSTSRPRFHIAAEPSEGDYENEGLEGLANLRHRHSRRHQRKDSEGESSKENFEMRTASRERWEKKKEEDDSRRYHALMELLTTEVGYLRDLRVLVSIYLHQFPTITSRIPLPSSHFMRTSPSPSFISHTFSGHSRSNSHTQLNQHPPSSYTLLQSQPAASSPTSSNNVNANYNSSYGNVKEKEKDKHKMTRLITDEEISVVTRNAMDLLEFHERFVDELREMVEPFGFSMDLDEFETQRESSQSRNNHGMTAAARNNVDEAVTAVTAKFATMAQESLFDIYQSFCSGHPEAIDLVRKIQQRHPAEWDMYEQRCSHLVADMHNTSCLLLDEFGASPVSAPSHVQSHAHAGAAVISEIGHGNTSANSMYLAKRKRRHSTSSVSFIEHSLASPHARSNTNVDMVQVKSDPSSADIKSKGQAARLTLMDYMIKPVQRICKYPLLLDQLKTSKFLRTHRADSSAGSSSLSRASHGGSVVTESDVDPLVEDASRAMRNVVALVDEARRRRDIIVKSSLIMYRIAAWSSSHPAYSSSSNLPGTAGLTPEFLSSLGVCLLAGSLDVMHYPALNPPSAGTVKVKYMGAFLYVGGYLILVKVGKGKVYEPRHWFSLMGFEVVSVEEEAALLPCSFRISRRDYYFELAAACQKEKDVWLAAIRESLTMTPPWINEPASSLQTESKGDPATSPQDSEPAEPLTSKIFIDRPSIDITEEPEAYGPGFDSQSGVDFTLKPEMVFRREPPPLMSNSRRSSTTSVKALFSPVSADSTMLIRSTPPLRQHVERGLLDVFSEVCLTARFQAQTHEEELFQAPRSSTTGSAFGMAGIAAKNRLSKRESVLVPRRKSFVDGYENAGEAELSLVSIKKSSLSRAKSLAARRQGKKSLRIMPLSARGSETEGEQVTRPVENSEVLPDSPSPMSQCSSVNTSRAGSAMASPAADESAVSPTDLPTPLPTFSVETHESNDQSDFLAVVEPDWRPKRTRSMVDNVRGLFYARPTSPTPSVFASSSQVNSGLIEPPQDWNQAAPPGRITKWWKGSLRRRVQSAPEVPREDPPLGGVVDGLTVIRTSLDAFDVPEEDVMRASSFVEDGPSEDVPTVSRSSIPVSGLARRPSLFSAFSNSSRRDTNSTPMPAQASPRKPVKNVTFLQRLNPLTATGLNPY